MTETHTGSRYLLQPIALDKPAVQLGNPKHIVWTNQKKKNQKVQHKPQLCKRYAVRWTEAQL